MIKKFLAVENRDSITKRIFKLIKPWLLISSILFLGYSIFLNISKLNDIVISKRTLAWLFCSTVISTLSLFLNAAAWKNIFLWLNLKTKGIQLIELYIRTNIFKYLPGGIWHFIKRLQTLRKEITTNDAMTAVVIEPFIMLAAALLLVPLGGFQSGISILSTIPSILLIPKFHRPIIKRIKRLKEQQINNKSPNILRNEIKGIVSNTNFGYPSKPLIIEILFISIRFLGFWLCLKAFSMDSFAKWNQWVSIFSIAWAAGLIIPGAPGGVGIFESIVLIRSGLLSTSPGMLAVLICYRLSVTISDLIAILLISINKLITNSYSK